MSIVSTNESHPTWLYAAFDVIEQSPHLNHNLCNILRAFGRDDNDAPGPTNLDPDALDVSDEADGVDTRIHLKNRIATELLDEVDSDQASMFSRRFVSVSTLLKEDICDRVTSKQLLRLALHRRTAQILSTTDPTLSQRKALRIRALVDFIWSLSLVLELKDSPGSNKHSTLVELAQEQMKLSHEFAPGFHNFTIEGTTSDFGPVHINVLRINLSCCQMKCIDARDKTTDLTMLAKEMGALAGISGGFFLYSEPDIEPPSRRTDPVGLLVSDGEIVGPPVYQRSAIVQREIKTGDKVIDLSKIGMDGLTCICSWGCASNELRLKIGHMISYDEEKNVAHATCIHRGNAENVIVNQGLCAFAIVGNKVVQRKIAPRFQIQISVPLAGFVVIFPEKAFTASSCGSHGTEIMQDDDVEISVSYELPLVYENAMAGGPMFFSDDDGCSSMDLESEDFKGSAPPVTFSQDETHDHNLLPRMGIGIAKCPYSCDEQLVCVAVDGRNLERALGLTLKGTSDLLRSLGCFKAMNLDGGSSKRMVIWDPDLKKHKVVCLSTTEIKANNKNDTGESKKHAEELSRPVHSAILFFSNP